MTDLANVPSHDDEGNGFPVSVGQMTHKEVEVNGWAGPNRARGDRRVDAALREAWAKRVGS